MALAIFRDTFGKERQRLSAVRNTDAVKDHTIEVVDAIQSVVDTLRDPKTGDRYEVALGRGVQAATFQGARRIIVTHEPIFDPSLTIAEACTVMTGLVLHEVGHTLYTFPFSEAFAERFGVRKADTMGYVDGQYQTIKAEYDRLAYYLWNIADDARLEAAIARRLPVAVDVFPSMLSWVATRAGMDGWRGKWQASAPMKARVDFALYATRYPWVAVWSKDPTTRAERLWWAEWRDQFVDIEDAPALIAAIEAGLDRLRSPQREEPEPEPEPEPGDGDEGDDEGESSDEGDERESKPGSEPGDDGESESDESDEDGEGEGNGDDESEDGDEDDDGMTGQSSDVPPDDWSDEDGDDGDQPGEGKGEGEGEGEDGEPTESEPGRTTDLTEDGSQPMGDKVIDPVTEQPDVIGSHPDDFDPAQAPQQVDDLQGMAKTGYTEGSGLQQHVDAARRNERVDLGIYGAARIEVNIL